MTAIFCFVRPETFSLLPHSITFDSIYVNTYPHKPIDTEYYHCISIDGNKLFQTPPSLLNPSNSSVFTTELLDYIHTFYYEFSLQYNRRSFSQYRSSYSTYQALLSYASQWLHLIKSHNIKCGFFDEDPHRAFDYVAYKLLKYYSLPTYIFSVLDASGYRSFVKYSIEDRLIDSVNLEPFLLSLNLDLRNNLVNYPENNFMPTKLHVSSLKQKQTVFNSLTVLYKLLVSLLLSVFSKKQYQSYFHPPSILKKYSLIYAQLLFILAFFRRSAYRNHIRKYSCDEPANALNSNSIIYCAHYFPERTSVPLALPYGVDQLNCINTLSSLSGDYNLYYKEHPSSLSVNNTHADYCLHSLEYIQSISKAGFKVFSDELPLDQLISSRCIIATLNGTIGLEKALSGGRVLTFGNAWYSFLPNVHVFSSFQNLQSYLMSSINYDVVSIYSQLNQSISKFTIPLDLQNRYKYSDISDLVASQLIEYLYSINHSEP